MAGARRRAWGLLARSAERLEREAAALRKATEVTVRTLAADLSDAADRQRVAEAFPDVDILINNAGAISGGTIEEVDEAAGAPAGNSRCLAISA